MAQQPTQLPTQNPPSAGGFPLVQQPNSARDSTTDYPKARSDSAGQTETPASLRSCRTETPFQRKAREYHEQVLAFLGNPRIDSTQRVALREYLADVPALLRSYSEQQADGTFAFPRSFREIDDIRETSAEVDSERARLLRRLSDATLLLAQSQLDASKDAKLTYLEHLRFLHTGRKAQEAGTALHHAATALARQASSAAVMRREQSSARRDWEKRGDSAAVARSPRPFEGAERFGMLRALSDGRGRAAKAPDGSAATYVAVTTDGVYSHTVLATRPIEIDGCPVVATGIGGALVACDAVATRGIPCAETLLVQQEERKNHLSSIKEERQTERLFTQSVKAIDASRERLARSVERRHARLDGTAAKRGSSKRKRGSKRGSKR